MWNRTAKTHKGTPKTLLEYKQSSQLIMKCNAGNSTNLWIFVFTRVNTLPKGTMIIREKYSTLAAIKLKQF